MDPDYYIEADILFETIKKFNDNICLYCAKHHITDKYIGLQGLFDGSNDDEVECCFLCDDC